MEGLVRFCAEEAARLVDLCRWGLPTPEVRISGEVTEMGYNFSRSSNGQNWWLAAEELQEASKIGQNFRGSCQDWSEFLRGLPGLLRISEEAAKIIGNL